MSGQGSASLTKHRHGKRLTPLQAIHAKCCDCLCDYADGRLDCEIPSCPLHPFMPYRGQVASVPTDDDLTETPRHPSTFLPDKGALVAAGAPDE